MLVLLHRYNVLYAFALLSELLAPGFGSLILVSFCCRYCMVMICFAVIVISD